MERNNSLQPGDIVSGLEPNEHVEVQKVAPFGNKILIEGVGVSSRRLVKRPLNTEELEKLIKIRGRSMRSTVTRNHLCLALKLSAFGSLINLTLVCSKLECRGRTPPSG
jgi:hypothetical protein